MIIDQIWNFVVAVISTLVSVLAFSFMQSAKKRTENYQEIEKYLDNNVRKDNLFNFYKKISKDKLSENDSEFTELIKEWITVKKDENKITEKLITAYHEQALSQAGIQFTVSLIAAITGFILIVLSFILNLSSADKLSVITSSFPGLVIDGVAALFFKQASDTRKRATDLYDRLRQDQQKVLALDIAESIENIELKDKLKVHLSLHISGVDDNILEKINSKNEEEKS